MTEKGGTKTTKAHLTKRTNLNYEINTPVFEQMKSENLRLVFL